MFFIKRLHSEFSVTQKIQSRLNSQTFRIRLATSPLFTATVNETSFEIREERGTKKALLPIISGQIHSHNCSTTAIISFKTSKFDNIVEGVFLIILLLIAILVGIFACNFFFTFVIALWAASITLVKVFVFKRNCTRALKKILKLTESEVIN